VFLEGKQEGLGETVHGVFNIIADGFLLVMQLLHMLLALSLAPHHLGHKAVDQVAFLGLAASHVQLVLALFARTGWTQQVLVALRLLEDLGD
jgi:chromate transport protein ChrA